MTLVRHTPGRPVVTLPAPLEPAPPSPAALSTLQYLATKDGVTIRLPNGYTIAPREKTTRRTRSKPRPGWWLHGETES